MIIRWPDFVGMSIFLTLSVIVVFFRKGLQKEYIEYCESHVFYRLFLPFARSKLFLVNCWICGILLFVMFLIVLLVSIFGTYNPQYK